MRSRRLFVVFYAASGAAALVYEVTWTRLLTLQVGHTVSAIGIVLAAAMGATFPIAASWFVDAYVTMKAPASRRSAADAGVLYAANTAGAAAGAIGAEFWLLPEVGLRATTWVGVALNGAAALGAVWLARRDAIGAGARAPSQ